MRCVQVQEMPPNPTHWTFSGLLFCFFRYVSPPHRWQLLSGGIMFSGSLILVLFFSVGIKDGLCFCGHRSEVSWLRGLCSDAWFHSRCWTVMSHPSLAPILCQRLSLLHNKYFFKNAPRKGQRSRSLRPHACLILVSEQTQSQLQSSLCSTTSSSVSLVLSFRWLSLHLVSKLSINPVLTGADSLESHMLILW